MISESDFHWYLVDDTLYKLGQYFLPKKYDVIFVIGENYIQDVAKNYTLACQCFHKLIDELNLSILILGKAPP